MLNNIYIKLILFIILLNSNKIYSQKTLYRVFSWQWAGLASNSTCIDGSISLEEYSEKLYELIGNKTNKTISFENDIKNFLIVYESGDIQDTIDILGFVTCEYNYITFKIYLYDFKTKKLLNAISKGYKIDSTYNSNDIINYIFDNIDHYPKYIPNSNFLDCLYPLRLDFLHSIGLTKAGRKTKDTLEYIPQKKSYNIDDIIGALKYFYKTRRYEYLDGVRNKYNTGDKNLKNVLKNYPHLFNLLNAIVVYRDYEKGDENKKKAWGPLLNECAKKLLYDDQPFTKKEKKKYLKQIDHQNKSKSLTTIIKDAIGCKDFFDTAKKFEENGEIHKALSMYLDVLKDSVLTTDSLIIKECGGIKELSFKNSKKILKSKIDAYKSNLSKAQKMLGSLESKDIINAQKLFLIVDSIDNGFSLYPRNVLGQIEKKLGKPQTRQQKIQNAERTMAQKLQITLPNTNLLNTVYNISQVGNTVYFGITSTDRGVIGWTKEINFDYGAYHSKNEEDLCRILVEALLETYDKFGNDIERIYISYTGSADKATFGKNRLKIDDVEYNKDIHTICECDNSNKLTNICYPFDKLKLGKGSNNSDYNKNLLLAYLRAYNRMQIIEKQLKIFIDSNKFSSDICPIVSKYGGFQYRNVDMEIQIKFR